MRPLLLVLALLFVPFARAAPPLLHEYPVPHGSQPHDVAPARDGGVWYTAQATGRLGYLDPASGRTQEIALGQGAAPHGVVVGPDGAPWITDGGLNAIVRVDPRTRAVQIHRLPRGIGNANLNTAAFDRDGVLWFTGQAGVYGYFDPRSGKLDVFKAPRGFGPYGICATPDGHIYYASLGASYIARIDTRTARATVIEPPTRDQGARRIWSDSKGRLWVAEWNAGQLGRYDPQRKTWKEWKLPGKEAHAYAVYVDADDAVWLTDFGNNSIVRFDPRRETFDSFALPSQDAQVRQLAGRAGEVWGAESGADKLVVVRH